MRPFKFLFGVLFAAAVAIVFLKLLFFAFAGLMIAGLFFMGARAFRHRRGQYPADWRHSYASAMQAYAGGDQYGAAEPIDPRQARPQGEPLSGVRQIEIF
ncbi:MAG: hypothetical protein U0U46_09255 [Saprospiraceae bacterium]|nr:hypothetical protein [Saprospiraceae bacterium]